MKRSKRKKLEGRYRSNHNNGNDERIKYILNNYNKLFTLSPEMIFLDIETNK